MRLSSTLMSSGTYLRNLAHGLRRLWLMFASDSSNSLPNKGNQTTRISSLLQSPRLPSQSGRLAHLHRALGTSTSPVVRRHSAPHDDANRVVRARNPPCISAYRLSRPKEPSSLVEAAHVRNASPTFHLRKHHQPARRVRFAGMSTARSPDLCHLTSSSPAMSAERADSTRLQGGKCARKAPEYAALHKSIICSRYCAVSLGTLEVFLYGRCNSSQLGSGRDLQRLWQIARRSTSTWRDHSRTGGELYWAGHYNGPNN